MTRYSVLGTLLTGCALVIASAASSDELGGEIRAALACARDVAEHCAGVMPGEGRIKACMKQNLPKLSDRCVDAVFDLMASDRPPSLALTPGAVPGRTVHTEKARDYAYCEIAPVIRTPRGVSAEFYNTTGTTGPNGGCPAEPFAKIDPKALGERLGTKVVYLNPTPQHARRHWVMDENWVYAVGETVDFDGVAATWMASMSPELMMKAIAAPYEASEIHRESQYLYKKGSDVYLLRDPEGHVWVMQSYATEVDPALSIGQLPHLGGRLTLPKGWTFETKVLDRDLTIDPRRSGGVAHIVRDALHNVYEGCGFDATCSFVP